MKAKKRKRDKILAVSIIAFWMWGTGIILGNPEGPFMVLRQQPASYYGQGTASLMEYPVPVLLPPVMAPASPAGVKLATAK